MLNVTLALRKQVRKHPSPLSHNPKPRVTVQAPQKRRLHVDFALMRPASAPRTQTAVGPDPALKPAQSGKDLQANSRWTSRTPPWPEYRAGDGHAAIQICLQHYAVISLEPGSPPALRMHDSKQALPENCCKLPGMLESSLDPGGAMALQARLQNTVLLQEVPPVLLETFWFALSEGMSKEGKDLFAHFNEGLPMPTTATECYRRLQAYVEWVRCLAD